MFLALLWNPFENKDLWKCENDVVNFGALEESLGLSHNTFNLETFYFFPELLLIVIIVPLWIGILGSKTESYRIQIIFLIVIIYLVALINVNSYSFKLGETFHIPFFNEIFLAATYLYRIKYIILCASFITLFVILLFSVMNHKAIKVYYNLFIIMAILAPFLILLQSATHLVAIFLIIETIAVILYYMAGIGNQESKAKGAVAYFIQGGVSSGLLLHSTIILALTSGPSLSIHEIFEFLRVGNITTLTVFAVNYFLLSLTFKLVSFPGYLWAEGIYKDVSYTVLIIFTVVAKFSFISFFLNIYWTLIPKVTGMSYSFLILVIVVVSLVIGLVGGLLAININNLKQFILYTGLNQIGFVLIPSIFFIKLENKELSLYYALIYLIANFLFIFTLIGISILFTKDDSLRDEVCLDKLNEVIQKLRVTAKDGLTDILVRFFPGIALVSVWSIAGLPPFGGFFTKISMWRSFLDDIYLCENPETYVNVHGIDLVHFGNIVRVVLIFSIISSIISLYYYFEFFRPFFNNSNDIDSTAIIIPTVPEKNSLLSLIVLVIVFTSLMLFLPLFDISEHGMFYVPGSIKDLIFI